MKSGVAIPSQTSTQSVSLSNTPTVPVQKKVGKLEIVFYENSVEMVFEGDVKGRALDIAIRLIPRRYKMWRNSQLAQLKKEK